MLGFDTLFLDIVVSVSYGAISWLKRASVAKIGLKMRSIWKFNSCHFAFSDWHLQRYLQVRSTKLKFAIFCEGDQGSHSDKRYFLWQGCAWFPEFLQNFSERQILWSLCLVVFHVLT